MDSHALDIVDGKSTLRQRQFQSDDATPQTDKTEESSRPLDYKDNPEENRKDLIEDPKTFGRTPDGTAFLVPQTHDMVSQLLSPSQPKNLSDILVLAILGLLILLFLVLPSSARKPVFAMVFLFWRACYNGGIGYLLHIQSYHRRLVRWAKRSQIFEDPAAGQNPHPRLYDLIKRELETKIPKDYKFDEAPIEYNTWLVFRRLVDLILMCDFVSYCLFAVACGKQPSQENLLITLTRWAAGLALVGFNVWVKLDAHRVVKDFAWYWGDFFYLIDQELTFDGVFEMAPHPMYSVGYAGYYGISLMAASYSVLFTSLLAHAAQFAFLYFVEDPHIEKTYNPPPTRTRPTTPPHDQFGSAEEDNDDGEDDQKSHTSEVTQPPTDLQPWPVHDLIGLRSTDLRRVTDVAVILLQLYMLTITVSTPSTPFYQALFVLHAFAWRLWLSVGLGWVLYRQSHLKAWTRHFVKYGESTGEAWRQWKGVYHLTLTMCYASFLAASFKMYSFPDDWRSNMALLKHVVGLMLVALQVWTAVSIYTSLGEFGWFFGDFFFDTSPKLTFGGIYRYLNNPERVLGLAGVWGAVLITRSSAIFALALFSHVVTLWFIDYIERPHMQKLYGQQLRREAGLVRSLKRSLPPPLQQFQGRVDRVLGETVDFVEDFIDSARPKFAAGVELLVKDTKTLFQKHPARLILTRLPPDLAGFDPRDYSLEVSGTALDGPSKLDGKMQDSQSIPLERRSGFAALTFEYGIPIKVAWTAPLRHGARDWVGLYKVASNYSRQLTGASSAGRWIGTNEGAYDVAGATDGLVASNVRVSGAERKDGRERDYVRGEMVFAGDKLWWTQGVFEFRYHHDGKYCVMAISRPFEIRVPRFDVDDVELDSEGRITGAVEKALLSLVQNCLNRNPEIAPATVDEAYGSLIERNGQYAKRIVYAVHQM
ncbi:MAG: phosphatidylethanolamine N-methyltransferase [Lichina confinis]|nr:MAG: phosphatidylethanolamine N-methyltransferase [Lichina confinis]